MGIVKNKKPVKYYDSDAATNMKAKLVNEKDNLLEKQKIINSNIDSLYEKYLQIAHDGNLTNMSQIKPLLNETSKLNLVKRKIEDNIKKLNLLENGKLEKTNIFKKYLSVFKRKKDIPIFYSEKESILLKYIYKFKLTSLEDKLVVESNNYLNLGRKINSTNQFWSLDERVVEVKQAKLLKKISKTKNEVKISKLEKEYNILSVNEFEPKLKFINNIQKKMYINKLFKSSKKVDRLKALIQKCNVSLIRLDANNLEKLNVFERMSKYFNSLNYKQQKIIFGILFILPWFVGFCIFFASPLISTIWWSFNNMITKEGGGYIYEFVGIGNYKSLFTTTTLSGITFSEMLTTSILNIGLNLPIIIIFSLFIAVLLNTKFKGHQVVKAIFFIPVVFNMSVINNTLNGVFGQMFSNEVGQGFALSGQFSDFLFRIGIGNGLVEFLTGAVDRIFEIVNMSGIQILIFIAALQSIPAHLYEAAKVEGATKYEMFWKITIPMVSPMILTTIVFTVVDSFATSPIIHFMTVNSQGTSMATNQPGLYSAISIIFFLVNALIILFVFALLKTVVFYYDD